MQFRSRLLRSPLLALATFLVSAAPALDATQQTRERWTERFAEEAIPLRSPADLAPLIEHAGPRRLFLLGESTHGTQEFYHWRHLLTRQLIEAHPIRFIAVEGDWEALYALNRYVKNLPEAGSSAAEVLATFDRWPQWLWANDEIAALAEWLRSHNAELPPAQQVGLYGLDLYGWGDSVEQLPTYLDRLRPGWGREARQALTPLREARGDNDRFRRAALFDGVSTASIVQSLLQTLEDEAETLRPTDPKAFLKAQQSLGLLRQAKLHLRGAAAGGTASWNPRAEHFMETVERLLTHHGDTAQGIVWAHNTHVGDARQTSMGPSGMVNLGQLARERLGPEDVFICGFAHHTGTVVAGRAWGDTPTVMTMPAARPDSFEAWLEAAETGPAALLLAPLRADPRLLQPGLQRAIGVTYLPELDGQRNYVPTVLPLRYDALLYFPTSTALAPLVP